MKSVESFTATDTSTEQLVTNTFAFGSLETVRKKLLDLTARNSLLNYKHPTASCLRLIDELPDQVFEELQQGSCLVFNPVAEPTEDELISECYIVIDPETKKKRSEEYPTAEQWAKYKKFKTSYDLPEQDTVDLNKEHHQDRNLQTLLYQPQMEARLRNLKSKAKTAIEESGSNILFLGIGFLEWFENHDSNVKRLAPLFTVPVDLEKSNQYGERGSYQYYIKVRGESLLTNITLQEKLNHDFNLDLPGITDDTTPEEYFDEIKNTILKHKPRWRIRRQATLMLLNFAKQTMYADLDPVSWPPNASIQDHKIISRFFGSTSPVSDSIDLGYEEEHKIDSLPNIQNTYPIVFDADSSQHSALIDAVEGQNLVIEGPPGSGKSQTIANLIAACIANGKRVLFVAEKMAALNVVKDRLEKVGLGDFCLEVHSHKTNRTQLLQDLNIRLNNHRSYKYPKSIDSEIERYEYLKDKLNAYVDLINSKWKNTDLTCHEIFQKATRYRTLLDVDPSAIKIDKINGDNFTVKRQKELLDTVSMLRDAYEKTASVSKHNDIRNNDWFGINTLRLPSFQAFKIVDQLEAWNQSLSNLHEHWVHMAGQLRLPNHLSLSIEQAEIIVDIVRKLPELVSDQLLPHASYISKHLDAYHKWLEDYKGIHGKIDKIAELVNQDLVYSDTIQDSLNKLCQNLQFVYSPPENKSLISSENLERKEEFSLVSIEQVKVVIESIQDIQQNLQELAEHFEYLSGNLPSEISSILTCSKNGIEEFNTLCSLVESLPQELWSYREDIYDSPDIDPLLEILNRQLNELSPLYQTLQDYFDLTSPLDTGRLKTIQMALKDSGLFSFLSPRYRKAKRQLRSISKNPKTKFKVLASHIEALIAYSNGLDAISNIQNEHTQLNGLCKGIDTPIDRALHLRKWYRSIRKEYGIGFGKRVHLGNSIVNMDSNIARSLLDYKSKHIEAMLQQTINFIQQQTVKHQICFTSQNSNTELIEICRPLLEKYRQIVSVSEQILVKSEFSIDELQESLISINQIHTQASNWKNQELNQKINKHESLLSISPTKYSEQLYSIGINTYQILCGLTRSTELLDSLINQPSSQHYQNIAKLTEELSIRLEKESGEYAKFKNIGDVRKTQWLLHCSEDIQTWMKRNDRAISNSNELTTWLDYIHIRSKADHGNLKNIIQHLEQQILSLEQIVDAMNLGIYHQLAEEILEYNQDLAMFNGFEQSSICKQFKEYDEKLLKLNQQKIAYQAAQNNPPVGNSSGKISEYTELGLIRHNLNLKKPRIHVRALMTRSGKAIQALKPCFMMSPMSVAQYLEPGRFNFDIVVMDEASQIRPEDALGSIARGNGLVVVGDPKQLPPTSFFQKITNADGNDDEDETVALEESESILETVIPMFKNRRLRWHYRSEHESLIAFSNHKFYDSNLVVFPSPLRESTAYGIKYKPVKGRFVDKRNIEEVKEIVKTVAEQLKAFPHDSIGIVAMNSEQRDEIERQLDQVGKDNPAFEQALKQNEKISEPLFIKNLENVQGDERDTIIISMTYGPSNIGASTMHQRFGPINSNVGWRRLNVLFTRARRKMIVHSSMTSGHICSSENSSRGVKALKAFLHYCEKGNLEFYEHTGLGVTNDFELSVMDALKQHGYECEPQLGVAGYYLDLAVKDPGKPGQFLMGVECDGASYHSAKSARDRDRLRQEILERLGWTIKRIWSTDWFKNPEGQLKPILEELNKLRTPIEDVQAVVDNEESGIGLIENIKCELAISQNGNEVDIQNEDITIPELFSSINQNSDEIVPVDLRTKLVEFDQKVIRKQFPNTEEDEQLLRPMMLEALLNRLPCTKAQFVETIPLHLRIGTFEDELFYYLENVLEIIELYR
ncbi:DUF4011 domain-containing protein [Planctomycetota bacterium]|nr:DUF4011 domain-containing protein [Planctomycetota bacterium]